MGVGAPLVKAGLKPPSWLVRVGAVLIDQLYPPACLNCRSPVTQPDSLCAQCFSLLRPISSPLCPRLGLPFKVWLGADALSAEAIADPPPFERARAAVIYNEVARRLVSKLKYGDRPEIARFCGRLMWSAGHELWRDEPLLVPVPLHRFRHFSRRYNQSAELAQVLSRLSGLAVDTALVRRRKATRQQVGLGADARQRNVTGAFEVVDDGVLRTRGRRVVIVDDVVTTGATVKAMTRALQRAGIADVDVISFARVVIGTDDPI